MAFATDDGGIGARNLRVLQTRTGAPATAERGRKVATNWPARRGLGRCPEIDCVRHLLAPNVAAAAELRANSLGMGAHEVLLAADHLTEEEYARALAFALKLPFEDLDDVEEDACPLRPDMVIKADAAGLLPLRQAGQLLWVLAPKGVNARKLVEFAGGRPEMRERLCITSSDRMRRFVQRHAGRALEDGAAHALRNQSPRLSAGSDDARLRWTLSAIVSAVVAVWLVLPASFHFGWEIVSTTVFMAWTALRLWAVYARAPRSTLAAAIADRELPTYTVLAALRGEAATLGKLVDALRALDYPPEKLDIKIVLEKDDHETQAAAAALHLGWPFEIVLAPASGPKTKPKALNAALPFARGEFTVIFDAEDLPEADQLRRALETFRMGGPRLACIQACLSIDNNKDNWLTRVFAAEYASLFDVLLPGLSARGLPIPLGGSSNHFRTDVLRRVGAWDAFNVTEDADLGMRLARFGYGLGTLSSSTLEEAPRHLASWLKQRTRWFKGWLQTWLVHMRQPVRLARDLGLAGFLTFQLMLAGTVFAALIQPFALGAVLLHLVSGEPGNSSALAWASTAALCGGYLATAVLGFLGLRRRGLLGDAWALLGVPLLWALLSIAAWRALLQLFTNPHGWEKTQHGLARTSRTDATTARSTAESAPERATPNRVSEPDCRATLAAAHRVAAR